MIEIKVKNVTKKIKDTDVLRNISMELHGGEVTGFAGTNGSGKTMLMRLISGLILPTEGEVKINGKVLGRDIEFPGNIGILIENPAFLDYYSGFQNLKLLASLRRRVGDAEIMSALERVGLDPHSRKKYKKYSLGMKQRLGIAGAIFEKPEILILDEPTNALDEAGILLLKQIVRQEKERGALVIISCHSSEILKELTDTVYVLESGQIKET